MKTLGLTEFKCWFGRQKISNGHDKYVYNAVFQEMTYALDKN